jgi:hypothetical protein
MDLFATVGWKATDLRFVALITNCEFDVARSMRQRIQPLLQCGVARRWLWRRNKLKLRAKKS